MSDHPDSDEPTVVELLTVRRDLELAQFAMDRAIGLLGDHLRPAAYWETHELIKRVNERIGRLTT